MPGKDGTGPAGIGKAAGIGRKTKAGAGRMGGLANAGPDGYCECTKCGEKAKHLRAEPCTSMKCPKCGSKMVRG